MPTTNPVPSNAAADLLFNAERIDESVNSSALTYVDRLGVERLTLSGAIARIAGTNPRGAWVTATLYNVKDLVLVSGTWYICVVQHTSGATFVGDATKWAVYQGITASQLADTSSANNGAFMVGRGFPVVDTITALRACLKTNPATRVFVTGYYAAGDGGGGAYYLDAADTTSADDGGSVIVATDGGRWKLSITQAVSVRQFGAKGDDETNDTAAFTAAVATGHAVYVPTGKYKINLALQRRMKIFGDGNTASIVKPYNMAIAAMTYTLAAMSNPSPLSYWNYHSEVRDIGFVGSAKTGIGFTFGDTTQAGYSNDAEYANNVRFPGCRFTDLEKGVQCPFGNIGDNFEWCGFDNCKYGIYSINVKVAGADVMHAGNKYVTGGEFHRNDVGIYVHDTAPGFGGICITDAIFQNAPCALYIYSNAGVGFTPVDIEGCWFESNGVHQGGNITIDQWTGDVRSDLVLPARTVILDGDYLRVNVRGGGVIGDWWARGTHIEVDTDGAHVEGSVGFGGGDFTVASPGDSYFAHRNPLSDGGWRGGSGSYVPIVEGRMRAGEAILSPGARAAGRVFNTRQRSSKVTSYGPSRKFSSTLVAGATTGGGSFNLTGSVVSDGRIYASCNEFTRAAFASNQSTYLNSPDSAIVTTAGWYVFTLDMKIVSGAGVSASVWDRSSAQLATGMTCNEVGKWYTFAGLGYSAGGQSLFLDFSGMGGTTTWRVSAYQIHRFDTMQEAQFFLESGVFAES